MIFSSKITTRSSAVISQFAVSSIKHSYSRIGLSLALVAAMFLAPKTGHAQLMNLQSIYYQNQYLANPSMAGIGKGLNINLDYQQQLTGTPGSPVVQSVTADANAGKNVGLGLIITNDKAGLLSRTNVMGTYAYHVHVSEEDLLNFGLSIGMNNTLLDYNVIVGDASDPSPQKFNQRSLNLMGGVGVSYLHKGLTLQASIPTLRIYGARNQSNDVDRSNFYGAISYLIPFGETHEYLTIEPKVALRNVKGFNDILDAGANFTFTNYHVEAMAMYHSNNSFSAGAGLKLNKFSLLVSYTANTQAYNTYASNMIEIGMKFKVFNN